MHIFLLTSSRDRIFYSILVLACLQVRFHQPAAAFWTPASQAHLLVKTAAQIIFIRGAEG